MEFFLELVPQGELTPHLHKLQKGDTLTFRKIAKGRFTLDTQSGRTNHFLLSTVTGIAPFVSYVRSLYKEWKEGRFPGEHKLFLIEGASRSWEFGYRAEIEPIAEEVPWLKYVTTVSRPWEDNVLERRSRARGRPGAKVRGHVGPGAGNALPSTCAAIP